MNSRSICRDDTLCLVIEISLFPYRFPIFLRIFTCIAQLCSWPKGTYTCTYMYIITHMYVCMRLVISCIIQWIVKWGKLFLSFSRTMQIFKLSVPLLFFSFSFQRFDKQRQWKQQKKKESFALCLHPAQRPYVNQNFQ